MIVTGKDCVGYFCVHTVGDKIDITSRSSNGPKFITITEEDLKRQADQDPRMHFDNGKLWVKLNLQSIEVRQISWLQNWWLNVLVYWRNRHD